MRMRLGLVLLAALLALLTASPGPGLATTTFDVNSTLDTDDATPDGVCDSGGGVCTLREAVREANSVAGTDTITFSIGSGQKTIVLGSTLPGIGQPVIIDGTTQEGFSGTPIIEVTGNNIVAFAFVINGGSSTVTGLVINRFTGAGITLSSNDGNVISGNYIGTDVAGTGDQGNGTDGIVITSMSGGNTIGGTTAAARNIISGNNGDGIEFQTSAGMGNMVQGNHIGVNATGNTALGNGQSGIFLNNSGNCIGGGTASCTVTAGAGNVISGNTYGIRTSVAGVTGNTMISNYIGTGADGTTDAGNSSSGVSMPVAVVNNTFGGTAAGAGNTIAFNGGDGVELSGGSGNAVRGNNIHSNTGLGIDLAPDGVTPNDVGDGDLGTNNLQNFPELSAATKLGGTIRIEGTLNSTATTSFVLDFFASTSCNAVPPNNFGEGETYLGSSASPLGTNGDGNLSFAVTLSRSVALGSVVTATATRFSAPLDTSEFSACVTVGPMVVDTVSDANLTTCDATDPADCSLRGAINNANSDATADEIDFDIPGAGPHTIDVGNAADGSLGPLPPVAQPATIYGQTEPDFVTTPIIELNGTSAGVDADGLNISGGSSGVLGLVINRFSRHGINLNTNGGNFIAATFIGTNVFGSAALGNSSDGILVNQISYNVIGLDVAGAGNLISGNGCDGVGIFGVGVAADNNVVQNNLIGTDVTGTLDFGNGCNGVAINHGTGNTIGGTSAAARNVISGNALNGAAFVNGANANQVQGNYIGTNATGTADLGNTGTGVRVDGSASNVIGGSTIADQNVISGNDFDGVGLYGSGAAGNAVRGNYIGTDASGLGKIGNSFYGVFISNAPGNCVGGSPLSPVCPPPAAAAGNVISGNAVGVFISGAGASGNYLAANRIGTDATGVAPLPNGHGIYISAAPGTVMVVASDALSGYGNVIAFNTNHGVTVDGATATGNFIFGNSIHSNGGLGIENMNGGNGELSPPVITSTGSAAGTICTGCTAVVYSDNANEGKFFNGATTDSNMDGAWSFLDPVFGPNVTATAIDSVTFNTSEFSDAFACADSDADSYCDSGDPCPAVPDCDGDGFRDGAEALHIGSDPLDDCADTSTASDELDDRWPPDFNDDQAITGFDLSAIAGVIGYFVPPAPPRKDIAPNPPDGAITSADMSAVAGRIGATCT